jgi:branched-chain amino acid transport system substrate-binding protein
MSIIDRPVAVFLGFCAAWAVAVAAAQAQPAPIKLGGMCDLSGSTKVIGAELCPGVPDYIALVNKGGGVLGHRLSYTEIDHAYVAPRAVEAYERLKSEGVVTVFTYGVPTLRAVSARYMEDRIPSLNPGTGRADAIDGVTWRYIFPGTASYWSQAGVALKYMKDNGAKPGTRVAYLYVDNPAGREGEEMVELARKAMCCAAWPCSRPASNSIRRSARSRATSRPTGSSPASSGARRRWRSRSSARPAIR